MLRILVHSTYFSIATGTAEAKHSCINRHENNDNSYLVLHSWPPIPSPAIGHENSENSSFVGDPATKKRHPTYVSSETRKKNTIFTSGYERRACLEQSTRHLVTPTPCRQTPHTVASWLSCRLYSLAYGPRRTLQCLDIAYGM